MKRFCILALVVISALVASTTVLWADPVEISFLSFFVTKDEALARSLIADFEKANPDIKVNLETSSYQSIPQKVLVRIAGGTPPDVIDVHPADFYSLVSQKALMDITDLVKRDIDLDDFFPTVLESVSMNNRIYAMPQRISTYVLFYNRNIFAETGLNLPPANWNDTSWNWDAFYQVSKKIRRDLTGDGKLDRWGFRIRTVIEERLLPFIFQAGNNMFDTGYNRFTLSDASGVKALSYIQSGLKDGSFVTTASAFPKGVAGMTLDIPPAMLDYKNDSFEFGVAALPQGPAGPATTIQPIPVAIIEQSKNKEAAWRFLQFYMSKTAAQQQSRAGIVVQPRRSVTGNPRYYPENGVKDITPFLGALAVGRPVPNMHAKFPEIANMINDALKGVWQGTSDPKTALESVKGPIEELLKVR
jgi:multiple sugar transport system substrate-binding protein